VTTQFADDVCVGLCQDTTQIGREWSDHPEAFDAGRVVGRFGSSLFGLGEMSLGGTMMMRGGQMMLEAPGCLALAGAGGLVCGGAMGAGGLAVAGVGAAVTSHGVAVLAGNGGDPLDVETDMLSSRATRREAMRDAGIPTSQQPTGQTSVTTSDGQVKAGRQLDYEVPKAGGGTQKLSVQHSLTDDVAGHGPHWEAGKVKEGGQVDSLGRPRLQNDKVKVDE